MPTPSEAGGREVLLEAPAKLNLGLAVLGRRPDGYHDLRTVFQAIDLADRLRLRDRDAGGIVLRVEGPEPVDAGPGNLVVRAGERMIREFAPNRGAEILLTKRIPVGAGLGGGSSDAAATLLGLESLWGIRLPPMERAALALELGSDVPFFLEGGTARGEGRGETLMPFSSRIPGSFVLVVPSFRIATARAFRELPQPAPASVDRLAAVESALRQGDLDRLATSLVNDLEPAAIRIEPGIETVRRELLGRGAVFAGLTGSGSALFALFRSEAEADRCVREGGIPEATTVMRCIPVHYGARIISG